MRERNREGERGTRDGRETEERRRVGERGESVGEGEGKEGRKE